MTYHATECIFDLIAACGPQEYFDIKRECLAQVSEQGFINGGAVGKVLVITKAMTTLENAGILTWVRGSSPDEAEGYYDYTDYGYELLIIAHDRLLPK